MLTLNQQKRWNNAIRTYTKIKEKAVYFGYKVMIDDSIIDPDDIVIAQTDILLKYSESSSCVLFSNDSTFDDGLQLSIKDFNRGVRETTRLIKIIPY